jgi:hypothetical protein
VAGEPVGRIRVERAQAPWRDAYRNYRVLLDGVEVGQLANGEVAEYEATVGSHTVRMKVDFAGSATVRVIVTTDAPTVLHCGPSGSSFTALFALLRAGRYIRLNEERSTGSGTTVVQRP